MITYAFIDSQNLNLGIQSLGWRLDYKKFYIYLRDKFRISEAFLFIGYLPTQEKLYKNLRKYGFRIVFKPTVKNRDGKVKGNVDAELVLHSAKITFQQYQKAIVISSDGDFYCLYKDLIKENKLSKILIPNKRSQSSLLKEFPEFLHFLEYQESKIKMEDVKYST